MSATRIPTFRRLAARPLRQTLAPTQRRWAQVHDVRFLATTQPRRLVLEKYREKLEHKARIEGLASIDELKAAYAEQIGQQRRRDGELPHIPQAPETPVTQPNRGPYEVPKPTEDSEGGETEELEIPQAPETPVKQPYRGPLPLDTDRAASPASTSGQKTAVKPLGDILDLDKVRDLPDKELSAIWRLRHASSPQTLCAVIPSPTYNAMEAVARTAPQFVLPVPHEGQGAEIHFMQWTFDKESRTSTVLFTQLAEFKARGEFAQPHTTITHHLDLADERGVVLMQGQVVEGRGVQPDEAKWLVLCLQKFYGGWEAGSEEGGLMGERRDRADERRRLLRWFASGDPKFSVEKLLEEAERMG